MLNRKHFTEHAFISLCGVNVSQKAIFHSVCFVMQESISGISADFTLDPIPIPGIFAQFAQSETVRISRANSRLRQPKPGLQAPRRGFPPLHTQAPPKKAHFHLWAPASGFVDFLDGIFPIAQSYHVECHLRAGEAIHRIDGKVTRGQIPRALICVGCLCGQARSQRVRVSQISPCFVAASSMRIAFSRNGTASAALPWRMHDAARLE